MLLCCYGFELYSRWVPLIFEKCSTARKIARNEVL